MKRTDGRKHLKPLHEWEYASWAGAEYLMLSLSARMTFRERLEWLENATGLFLVLSSAEKTPMANSKR